MSAELFLSLIAREPMLMTLDGAVSFAARLRCDVPRDQKPSRNFLGDTVPQMRIENGTAFIPVVGPMIKNAGFLLKGFGAVAHEDIASNLDEAASSASVSRIALMIDSPGGTVSGTPELADKTASVDAKKPVYAFTDSLAASAAFWIASGARGIYATKSARVGSIGALLEVTNFSEALRARGIAVEVFATGPLKAAGHPARPMTDEARQYFQAQVDSIGQAFKSFVAERRRGANQGSMTGAVFFAPEAKARGLIDAIVPSANAMLAEFRTDAARPDFQSLLKRELRAGKSKGEAILAVAESHPEAHLEYVRSGGGPL
ncbi:MAG: S49 family peptidase [Verrucomicrobia bacterium]|nr:S49 family peptidase [Verrucomicrobiota bacterium]